MCIPSHILLYHHPISSHYFKWRISLKGLSFFKMGHFSKKMTKHEDNNNNIVFGKTSDSHVTFIFRATVFLVLWSDLQLWESLHFEIYYI